jgi:serine/threonine-protein kinase
VAENYPIEFGDYRLLRKLAQGGMAEIFLAQDQKGGICAIKRILPHLAHEESFIRMFIDEARIVSHIQHGNVAQVYDQGKASGYYYIAMEFVQGHSLLALSERAKSMKIPLPRGLLAHIVAELLGGLGSAHSARDAKGRHLGIVHRDVTPQNVLISYDGEVKLIDFGVAKARARLTQTEAGFTKGKLSYMSPEQARGEELDSRSDLFSVGIVLHEITTGGRLFNKEGPGGILGAIVNDPIPPPSLRSKDYPKELEQICMRALDKDVDRRWQSAEEMRDALQRFAKKEKPTPGKNRLKDLVHDLFGDPDSAKVIEAARAVVAPTPANVPAHTGEIVRGASVRKKGEMSPEPEPEKSELAVGHRSVIAKKSSAKAEVIGDDETRMLNAAREALPSRVSRISPAKLEVTSEGTPILDLNLIKDAHVPEPVVPARVKLARFLAAFAQDLRVSWRAKRRKWILGLSAGTGVFLFVVLWAAGLLGSILNLASKTADAARELKQQSGLNATPDAGTFPTVLRLLTDPPGASIAINGFGMGGTTPLELDTLEMQKTHSVELKLAGYRPKIEKITLFPNSGTQTYTVKLDKMLGSLRIESDPPGARVSIGGKQLEGSTPMTLTELAADRSVKVTVSKGGRVSRSAEVTIADGQEQVVSLELPVDERAIPPGKINISSSPTGCPAWVDEAAAGRTPITGYEVKAGPHSVRVKCDNYAEEFRAIAVRPNATAEISVSAMTANVFGWLTINPIPRDGTTVQINGIKVELPVEFRKVVPGRHSVLVENVKLRRKKELTVDVAPNAKVTRDVNLVQ